MFPVKQNLSFLNEIRPDLEKFSEFLLKWQKSVNLISPHTIPFIWERHLFDSAQLYPLVPNTARVLVDMGSGGGFPGIILALINQRLGGPLEQVVLVESDSKKCVFLSEAARLFQLPVQVLNKRMELVKPSDFGNVEVDVLTARALAPVPVLLELSQNIRSPQTMCLFLKGEHVLSEMAELKNPDDWKISYIPSVSDRKGVIVQMRGVHE